MPAPKRHAMSKKGRNLMIGPGKKERLESGSRFSVLICGYQIVSGILLYRIGS